MQIASASPSRPTDPTSRSTWHRKASRPVSFWLVGLLVLAVVHRWIPQSRWLLVHMFTLGMVTNSILVWGQHFSDALLRTSTDDAARATQVWRIRVLNAGIVVTCAGMVGQWPVVAAVGAAVVGLCLCWYAVSLLGQIRRSLPARFTSTVRFYVAAALMLPVGATLGGIMAFSQPEPLQGRLLLAHLFTNLGGFLGLTAIGTLVTLWPTVLRTKMEPGQDRAGLIALWLMSVSVVVGVGAALGGVQALSALAVVGYLGGLVVIGIPLLRCALRKPPRDYPGYSIGMALFWLAGCLVMLLVKLSTASHTLVVSDLQGFTVAFVVGFGAQLLFGAMSYLMPTVMGGGPALVRTTCAVMNRGGALRASALNASLLAYLLVDDSWTRVLTSLIAFASLAAFLPLMLTMVRTAVAARRAKAAGAKPGATAPGAGTTAVDTTTPTEGTGAQTAPVTPPRERPAAKDRLAAAQPSGPGRREVVEAALGIGGTLGAVALGRRIGTGGGPRSSEQVAATGLTTTVEVKATQAMRFEPETIDVPPGNRLVIKLSNADPSMVHDLYLDNGATTGRLNPGQTETLDAGVVSGSVEGWCTIVGHRAMGMVLHVRSGATASSGAPAPQAGPARTVVDLAKEPGADFTTRDPKLPVLPTGNRHPVELTVTEARVEVAPGFTQQAMTYNGRVMGPALTVHLGDVVEAHLVNDGTMGHSIDFHAGDVGPDAVMRTINPGESLDYRFTARRAGIWLYHCSTMPMSAHIAAGMYGAVVVPPRNLARVQREYLLVQQELYLGPEGGEVDPAKIADERPDLTVWNGHANQYVFDPLVAKVGERVRIWVLAAGPSRGLSFHVVGAQFDTVFKEGAYLLRAGNSEGGGAQALDLAAAQGGFVEMVFTEPGTYTFVNHSFVEMERGARGLIKVS